MIQLAKFQLQSETLFNVILMPLLTFWRPGSRLCIQTWRWSFLHRFGTTVDFPPFISLLLPHKSFSFTLSLAEHLSLCRSFLCSHFLLSFSFPSSSFSFIYFSSSHSVSILSSFFFLKTTNDKHKYTYIHWKVHCNGRTQWLPSGWTSTSIQPFWGVYFLSRTGPS